MKTKEFDIAVIHGGKRDLLDTCLASIHRCSDMRSVNIIVVDNRGDRDRTLQLPIEDGCDWVVETPDLAMMNAFNVGLSCTKAEHVVLLHDDTEVMTDGWLVKMREGFNKYKDVAVVGPKQPWGDPEQNGLPGLRWFEPKFGGVFGIGKFPMYSWCSMYSRESLYRVGLFDMSFEAGRYGGDDDDWMARAVIDHNMKIVVNNDVLVRHIGSGTVGKDPINTGIKEAGRSINLQILKSKWRDKMYRFGFWGKPQ